MLFKESKLADKAKHSATIINKASMSIDEPTTLKRYSKKLNVAGTSMHVQSNTIKRERVTCIRKRISDSLNKEHNLVLYVYEEVKNQKIGF